MRPTPPAGPEPRHAPRAGGRPAAPAGPAAREGLARRIRTLRERRGLTQEDFARACGISVSFASQLERGERSPSYDTLLQVASALGLPLAELFLEAAGAPPDAQDAARAAAESRLLAFVRTRALGAADLERLLALAELLFAPAAAGGAGEDPARAAARCTEDGCSRAVLARALCAAHYHRARRASQRAPRP
ncbi:helix-turn-helix transcriptional regulator [Aggregicoccus sp. 17bor-14]|uniref:helix-turn-helix domain-containing protein n=1 Tax=Myxococcaceae TaxID=31 RepID=UPI00129CDC69|nr:MULTISPECIES: helix-turn-helix transcriptional regulator [Myxococcaceae]MBF5044669.1 helix-turn-helix transcriptional regulator [Simulacricoccus sp. 17bor-14]MRI90413.1 helix-turn-helix transcriptional regulator [Aggregicoccus sp. 17bor-14]